MTKNAPKTLLEQLLPIRAGINKQHISKVSKPFVNVMKWKEDGVDHINLWYNPKTELGALLSHDSDLPFYHSIFGYFCNISSFWCYISSEERDDRIRVKKGQLLKDFSRKLTKVTVPNFKAIIMDTAWQRISLYPSLMKAIKESTLPFECYYINNTTKMRQRPNFFNWMLAGYEEIRTALKEEREPNFNFLVSEKNKDIYFAVRPNIEVEEVSNINTDIKPVEEVKEELIEEKETV